MSHTARGRGTAASSAVLALVLGTATACAPTTYDASLATTSAPSTSTTLPVGTAAELLPVILEEVRVLSTRVADNDGDTLAAARIEALWSSIADEVLAARPDLAEDFDFVVSRCRLAVDRQRPADADRAYRNLAILVAEFVSD